MRRPAVVLLLGFAVTVAVAVLAWARPADARHSARLIVCPLSNAAIIPCCGPPVVHAPGSPAIEPINCCPGTVMCARGLSVGTTPDPSTASEHVAIAGQLTSSPSAGAPVVLWQRLPGRRQFQRVATGSTDGSGAYSITRDPTTNREWYVTSGGLQSVTVEQRVTARVTLTEAARSRRTVTVDGMVRPSHAHQRMLLESRAGGRWTVIARMRLDGRSHWHATVMLPAVRSDVLEAVLPGDSRNMRSSSAPFTVEIR